MLVPAVMAIAVAALDYLTGYEISISIFYLVPVSVGAWFVSRAWGYVLSLSCALFWFANDSWIGGHPYSHAAIPYWNAIMRLGIFLLMATVLAKWKVALRAEKAAHRQLAGMYQELDRTRREQLMIKDQILSHVSHELRTPLTAAHQFVTLVLDGISGDITELQRKHLGTTLRNINQLNAMIGDLLDASRVESGKLVVEPRSMSLGDLVADLVQTLDSRAAASQLAILAELPQSLPHVWADPVRVRQILFNLVDNAIKFTPPGGRIVLRASLIDEASHMVRVSVQDTGRGIPAETQKDLFKRLFQVQDEDHASRHGLGLGLFISREFVQRLGGTIWVESAAGVGSTFHFTLPLVSKEN